MGPNNLVIYIKCGIARYIAPAYPSSKGKLRRFCQSNIARLEYVWRLWYNLYHCRLGYIHKEVVCALDNEEEYTRIELQTMKLRPEIG